MNSQDPRDAAKAITEAANRARVRASKTRCEIWAALFSSAARQLQDRAEQVNTWAAQADHTGEVTPDMAASAFLTEAGL